MLRDEVENSIIRNKGFKEDGDINISDSFIGNSLGGLYQRYAISFLSDTLEVNAFNGKVEQLSQKPARKSTYIPMCFAPPSRLIWDVLQIF